MGDANPWLKSLWEEIMVLESLMDLWNSSHLTELNRSNLSHNVADNKDGNEEMKKLLHGQSTPSWRKALG